MLTFALSKGRLADKIFKMLKELNICDISVSDDDRRLIITNGVKKEGKFPAWKWSEYTHQESRNRYQICFYAPTPAHAEHPVVDYVAFLEEDRQRIVVQWGCWMYRKHGSLDAIATRYVGLLEFLDLQSYEEWLSYHNQMVQGE